MKLSLLTFPTQMDIRQGKIRFEDFCAALQKNGIRYVDMMKPEVDLNGASKTLEILHNHGLKTGCYIANIPMGKINDRKVSALLKEALETAKAMEAGTLMIIPLGMLENIIKPRRNKQKLADSYIHNFRLAVELAKNYGIQVAFEDTPSCRFPLSSAQECKKLLEAVDGLKLVFDTANMVPGGDEPLEFYRQLKPHICHVHLKDIRYVEKSGDECADGRFISVCMWGDGIIPVRQLAELLEGDGFDGICAIEYTKPVQADPEGHREHIGTFLRHLEA